MKSDPTPFATEGISLVTIFSSKLPLPHCFGLILVLLLTHTGIACGIDDERLPGLPEAVFAGSSDWLIALNDASTPDERHASQAFSGINRLFDDNDA